MDTEEEREQISLQDYLAWLNRDQQLIVDDAEFWQRQGITTAVELGDYLNLECARNAYRYNNGPASRLLRSWSSWRKGEA